MSCTAAVVQYAGYKHCFLNVINAGLRKDSGTKPAIQVYEVECENGNTVFLSLQGEAVLSSESTLQISGLFATKLGIKDEETIILKNRPECYAALKVTIEPSSVDDWEILERHAAFVESHLLDQVRVVWPGLTLPVWVEKSVCIFLKICESEPKRDYVVLQNDTEVIISPKTRPGMTRQESSVPKSPAGEELSNGEVMPRGEGKPDFIDGGGDTVQRRSSVKKSPRTSREKGGRKFRKTRTDRYSSSLSETELLYSQRQQQPLRRQNSLTDSLWAKVSSWLQWSPMNARNMASLPSLPRTIERTDAYTLPWQNFVFRVQAMKFTCMPEDLYTFGAQRRDNPRQSQCSSAQSDVSSPTRDEVDMGGSVSIATLSGKQSRNTPGTNDPAQIAHLLQPSTIFANIEDISKKLDAHGVKGHLPCVFYAKLRKLNSPKEREEEKKQESQAGTTSPVSSPTSTDPDKKESGKGESLRCVVRVVGMDKRGLLAAEGWGGAVGRLQEEQPLAHDHILVPDLLRRQMKLDVTGRVWLHTVPLKPHEDVRKLFIYPLSVVPRWMTRDMVVKALSVYLENCSSNEHPLVVFQGLLLKFMLIPGTHLEVQLTFSDQEPGQANQFCLMTAGLLQQVTVSVMRDLKDAMLGVVSPLLPYRYVSDFDPLVPTITLADLGGMESLTAKGLQHLEMCLGTRPLSRHLLHHTHGLVNGMLLITGAKGAGKSCMARALCRHLAELPTLAHVTVVECKPLRGKRVDNIQKALESVFDEAVWRQPAIILLDDLDVICGAPGGPESEMSGEALYAARVAEVVQSLIRFEIKNNSRLAVIAVSQSQGSLHPLLMSSRGIHFIQETLTIKPPDKNGRMELLEKIVQNRRGICLDDDLDMMAIAQRTEGFVARDFDKLLSRAMHARYAYNRKKGVEEEGTEVVLRQADLEVALTGFQPAALRNVPLHQVGELGWEDVGGLTSIKKILVETLMWPAKYPQLFASCPLRLRSGLLLYGAPGTGKTLLAGVVARECGLNFISIKGPELLSKYIGASEQAVRDLFTRAQSAKPCILFFDEFDSLAPRRGHDSTGVTDRVVNQLLTELDGVEGLEGVYVLGATSRPDLIDPALLRPGRLDKCLHCQLPTEEERQAILEALTRKMHLGKDVDLAAIAGGTRHCSGADLKALLYNAQLEAIHETSHVFSSPPSSAGLPSQLPTHPELTPSLENHAPPDLLLNHQDSSGELAEAERSPLIEEEVVSVKNSAVQGALAAKVLCRKGSLREKRRPGRLASLPRQKSLLGLQVTVIPKLEEGPVELLQEEEDKVLAMVNELRKRAAQRARRHQELSECGEGDKTPGLVEVTQAHLLTALEQLHPSVGQLERAKFDQIYNDFMSSRRGDSTLSHESVGKRATLA